MKIFFSFLIVLMFSIPAWSAPKSAWGPCRGEIHSYCSQIPKGQDNERISCLSKNKRNLSDKCQEHLAVMKERRKKALRREQDHIAECSIEEKKYCRNVEPGNGRVRACLRLHRHKISDKCQDALKKKSFFF